MMYSNIIIKISYLSIKIDYYIYFFPFIFLINLLQIIKNKWNGVHGNWIEYLELENHVLYCGGPYIHSTNGHIKKPWLRPIILRNTQIIVWIGNEPRSRYAI